jgi:hypothetical protein
MNTAILASSCNGEQLGSQGRNVFANSKENAPQVGAGDPVSKSYFILVLS